MHKKLELKNVYYGYKKNSYILKNLNLTFPSKKITVILGQNGAGKTTLLKSLCGFIKPLHGKILLNNKNLNSLSPKEIAKRIAIVGQESNYIFPYTALEMVVMGRSPHLNFFNTPTKSEEKIAYDSLVMVGALHLATKKINEMSSGELQMVILARALCQNPDILLLDEPNNHLDIHNQWHLFNLVTKLSIKNNLTVIAILHSPEFAYWFADNIIMLKGGKILHQGSPKQIMNAKNLSKLYDMPVTTYEINENYISIVPESIKAKKLVLAYPKTFRIER